MRITSLFCMNMCVLCFVDYDYVGTRYQSVCGLSINSRTQSVAK